MNLRSLFEQAVTHQQEHDCSAHPYENYEKLFEIVNQYQPQRILEIGTGIGFTSIIMARATELAHIDTIEKDSGHAKTALEFTKQNNGSNRITIYNKIAEEFLPQLNVQYDLIFFDGFQIHYEFLPHYERLLRAGGILVVGNNHLNSKTSDKFFAELNSGDTWQVTEKFSDTTVAKKIA